MDKYIEILKDLKIEIEKSIKAEHLVNNQVQKNQPIVDKIIAKKKLQIDALDNVLKKLK